MLVFFFLKNDLIVETYESHRLSHPDPSDMPTELVLTLEVAQSLEKCTF